jgi:hypothetical protein
MPPTPEEYARGFRTTIEVPDDDVEVLVGELIGDDG